VTKEEKRREEKRKISRLKEPIDNDNSYIELVLRVGGRCREKL
jgi:hypothetical protein